MQLKYQALISMCAALLVGCGSSTPTATTTTPPAPVTLSAQVAATPAIAFSPNTVTILRGGAVTFDFGSVPHNVYFDGAPAGAPANIAGTNASVSRSLTFNTTGTFVYNCHIHPGMQGKVVVVDSQ